MLHAILELDVRKLITQCSCLQVTTRVICNQLAFESETEDEGIGLQVYNATVCLFFSKFNACAMTNLINCLLDTYSQAISSDGGDMSFAVTVIMRWMTTMVMLLLLMMMMLHILGSKGIGAAQERPRQQFLEVAEKKLHKEKLSVKLKLRAQPENEKMKMQLP